MSVADELDRLHRLHLDGILTDEELDRARAAVLVAPPVNPTADQLDELRRQNEAARLDREWEVEREQYMVRDKAGDRYISGRTGNIVSGVLSVALGIVWVAVSVSNRLPVFALIGVVITLVGIGMSAHIAVTTGRYVEARRRYQERRAAIVNRRDMPAESR